MELKGRTQPEMSSCFLPAKLTLLSPEKLFKYPVDDKTSLQVNARIVIEGQCNIEN